MNCPICQHTDSYVITTTQVSGHQTRRRRECTRCRHRWNTYETPANVVEELAAIKAALRPVAQLVK